MKDFSLDGVDYVCISNGYVSLRLTMDDFLESSMINDIDDNNVPLHFIIKNKIIK
jgi:hypothetical protein